MRIRLLVGWNGNEAGAELDLDRGQASLLVDRGKAERIPEPDAYPAVLQKAEKPAEDNAIKHAPANKSRPKKKR
jgi:hypothetical protein